MVSFSGPETTPDQHILGFFKGHVDMSTVGSSLGSDAPTPAARSKGCQGGKKQGGCPAQPPESFQQTELLGLHSSSPEVPIQMI